VVGVLQSITADDYIGCTCWPKRCHVEIVIAAWRWLSTRSGAQ
jgi:hypothetical protein